MLEKFIDGGKPHAPEIAADPTGKDAWKGLSAAVDSGLGIKDPAVSQAQQRFMAACEHGAGYSSCPKGMTHAQEHDFAATTRKGLPEHVKHK